MDFRAHLRLRVVMDEDQAELVRQLYTRAGMALEDGADLALRLGSPRSAFEESKVAELENGIERAANLVRAAYSLLE